MQLKISQEVWQTFHREGIQGIQMPKKHKKDTQYRYPLREWELRYHYIPTRMSETKRTGNTKCCRECEKSGILKHWWWEHKIV